MAPPRFFGSRQQFFAPKSPRPRQQAASAGPGGFAVGPPPVQSTVASPSPSAGAGVSGQPASLGQPDDQFTSDGGTSPSTPTGNANVTGANPGLVSLGADVATTFAGLPGLGAFTGPLGGQVAGPIGGLIGSMLGSVAQSQAQNSLMGAIPNSMVSQDPATQGQQANYAGPTSLLGLLGSFLGGNVPQVTTQDPTAFGLANAAQVAIPSPSPNMGGFTGLGNTPSTFAGANTPGVFGDITGIGSRGVSPTAPGRQAGVAPGNQNVPNQFGQVRGNDPIDADLSDIGFPTNTNTAVPADFVDPVDLGMPTGTNTSDSPDTSGPSPIGSDPTGQEGGDAPGAAPGESGVGPGTGTAPGDASDAGAPGTPGGAPGDAPGDDGAPGPGDTGDAGAAGGGGGAGGGGASLLCNLALDGCGDAKSAKKHRRDLDAIAERAFRSQPKMKESFRHYQAASRQIIAKVKALSAEDQAGAYEMLSRELVIPVTKAARRGDITAVGRSLRKITRKLASEYDVKIPQEHIIASEELIGKLEEDDKPYVPKGRVLPPSAKKLVSMLEPDEAPEPESPVTVKPAGIGGFSVGLA